MDRKPAFNLLSWLLCLALTLVLAPVTLAEEEKKEEKKTAEETAEPAKTEAESPAVPAAPEKESSEAEVFTNEDLERLFGGAVDEETAEPSGEAQPVEGAAQPEPKPLVPAEGAAPAQPADPQQWMEERNARQADRQQQIAESEAAVDAGRQRVADLEQRLLATKNPFLARPKIPDDVKSDWDVKSEPESVAATEEQLRLARE